MASSVRSPLLSVVFSFKNEEENLPELIRRLRSALAPEEQRGGLRGHELIFVNDRSTDRSLEILLEEARDHGDIRIVNMSRTFGVTPCVIAGLVHASGDLVVYMDADLQDPPELIPEMLRVWREKGGIDVIHTVRTSREGETRIKLLITRLGYYILNRTTNINVIPNAGDFKMLSRRVVDHLVRFHEKKPFMRGLVQWVGFDQTILHYKREARYGGKTKFPVLSGKVMKNFFESALISFSDAPLHLVSLTGLLVSFFSFLLVVYVIVGKILNVNVPGWTGIMATILFLGGVQLTALGIIGLYVSTIYQETKGRPNYIVESTFGFDSETGTKEGRPGRGEAQSPKSEGESPKSNRRLKAER